MTINLDTVYAIIIAAAPALSAILSIILAVLKNRKDISKVCDPIKEEFIQLRKEVQDKTELEAVKTEMLAIMTENRQIRQELADLITAINKTEYKYDKKI